MPCVNTILRHKTCYSEEIIQKDLSKTGAFTEKNPQTGDFKNNSGMNQFFNARAVFR